MNKLMDRFNRWYDGIQEPWRFLTMLGLVTPAFVGLSLGYLPLSLLSMFYLLFLLFLRVGEKF